VLLIYPPIAKPSEPPPGIARLSGALSACGVEHEVLDANIEAIHFLLLRPLVPTDTWTARAVRNRWANLRKLRTWQTYRAPDVYKRAVLDINRLLRVQGSESMASLVDYRHARLSPVRSQDLLRAAEHPENDPFYEYFSARLFQSIERCPAPVAGFSLNFLSQALSAFAMIGFLKREFPDISVILGGGLVTSWMSGALRAQSFKGLVDHWVSGPGEFRLLQLLRKATSGNEHFAPRYDSFPMEAYLSPGRILPYNSSTGCYWGTCSFCPERAEGNPYSQISPDKAAAELSKLAVLTKPVLVHLVDNAVSPALMEALIRRPPGTPWYGFARITQHLQDPDFCAALRRSGCVMLKLGLESGSQDVLDALHKGTHLGTASGALRALSRAGIPTYVYLLFGTPAESIAEARATLDFVVAHRESISFLNAALFNLPINSPEAAGLETSTFYEGDLSLYTDFRHPLGWSRRLVRQFLDREFRRHPATGPILRNQPPLFTSNHAPFLVMGPRT
jgi:hypothetical protein